jgi:hypothetical protein
MMLLVLYSTIILPFTVYMKNRTIEIKLGYVPEAETLKLVSGDQRFLVAELSVLKVFFYFGSVIEKINNSTAIVPEYRNMYKLLETGVKLDPYNSDAYYFAQAAFTWEVGRAEDVNKMLVYGMKYRTWDYTLPFFAGFNAAYFLKDYQAAAGYMKQAAEMSGNPLYTTLAARYFYESRREGLGIAFLDYMEKSATDPNSKRVYALRKEALIAISVLDSAVARFKALHKKLPTDLEQLVQSGLLKKIPKDPYGGWFYLDKDGMIRSTSKLALRKEQK